MTRPTSVQLTRYSSLSLGSACALFGILGLIPPLHENWPSHEPTMAVRNGRGFLFGIFPNNIVMSATYILVGLWGMLGSRGGMASLVFVRSTLAVFGILAVLGLAPGVNSFAGLIPTFGATALLHIGMAGVLACTLIVAHMLAPASGKVVPRNGTRPVEVAWLHDLLTVFPLAFLVAAVGTDLAHWWTTVDWYLGYNGFWATASVWLIGVGLASGILALITGLLDLATRSGITRGGLMSPHAVGSVVALLLATLNLVLRAGDNEARIIPWGILLSLASAGAVVCYGWYASARINRERANR